MFPWSRHHPQHNIFQLLSSFHSFESHWPMASFRGTMVKMVVAVCMAVLLLSMGPTAMADLGEDCRNSCIPGCQLVAPAACRSIVQIAPLLKVTCEERFRGLCAQLCITFCNANTLPQSGTPLCLNP